MMAREMPTAWPADSISARRRTHVSRVRDLEHSTRCDNVLSGSGTDDYRAPITALHVIRFCTLQFPCFHKKASAAWYPSSARSRSARSASPYWPQQGCRQVLVAPSIQLWFRVFEVICPGDRHGGMPHKNVAVSTACEEDVGACLCCTTVDLPTGNRLPTRVHTCMHTRR